MTPFQLNKCIFKRYRPILSAFYSLSFLVGSEVHAADDIQYFNQPEMDFWKKAESKPKVPAPLPLQKSNSTKETSFPWKKYLDPKNDEFFREGDYLPPAPFMEIARDPSDENIDHWFKYLETKNELTRKLQARLSEYASKHPQESADLAISPRNALHLPEPQALRADARRFRLRLYFDSKCPHCEKMIETLKGLSQRGYSIELKQIDADTQARSKIPFPVSGSTPTELKQYGIEAVPVLLVGDLKARTYFKIQGYQTESSVIKSLSDFSSKQEGAFK